MSLFSLTDDLSLFVLFMPTFNRANNHQRRRLRSCCYSLMTVLHAATYFPFISKTLE
ncbi:hypothetical protein BT69DRAFT_1291034 [Atractiella rhizophila]|nr:hypothetical protein BT69DRAFT_1291034 [Atractiella rhizophila]